MKLRFLPLIPLFALSACAQPQQQPQAVYAHAPGLEERDFVPGDADLAMGLRQWLPAAEEPETVILALHGFNDYSRAFQRFGEVMAAHNVAVIAPDQRGFGRSPSRGIWPGSLNLKQDAARLVAAAHARYPKAKIYLLGESMGAAVSIAAVADGIVPRDQLAGLILVAPAVWGGDTFNPLYRAPLWLLANFSPDTVLTGKGLKILPSDNFPMLVALSKDPGMVRSSRADAVLGLVKMMDEGQEAGARLPTDLPVLILYGQHDQIVPPLPVARLAESCIARLSGQCRARHYPDGFHMLLRDLNADQPMGDIITWLQDHGAALPSGADWQPDTDAHTKTPSAPSLPGVGGAKDAPKADGMTPGDKPSDTLEGAGPNPI